MNKTNFEEVDKVLSIFFHNITNTIGATENFFALLNSQIQNIADTREFLTKVSENISYTNILLSNIISWYYLMNNKLFIDKRKIYPKEIITFVLENLNTYKNKKNIRISFDNKPELQIVSDENILFIVLKNILHNAIKFSEYNSAITIDVKKTNNNVTLKIEDTGIGLGKIDANKIFNLDYIKSNKRIGTDGENGSGLSLYISKKLLASIGVDISIQSNNGQGTTVMLKFPI